MDLILLFILSLPSPSRLVTGAMKNYDEILLYSYHEEKLVFDVTSLYNPEPNGTDGLKTSHGTLIETGVRLSPIIYYSRDESYFNDTKRFLCDYIEDRIPNTCEFIHRPSINFLVSGSRRGSFIDMNLTSPSSLATLLNASRTIRDQVFKIIFPHQKSKPWLDPQVRRQIGEKQGKLISFIKSEWPYIKIGLEYDDGAYWDDSLLLVVNLVDIIILNIDIPLEELSLSYSLFKSKLTSILHKNSEFLHKSDNFSDRVTIYAKLNFPKEELRKLIETDVDREFVYEKYYYYLLQFSVFWLNEKHKEGIILGAFSQSTASQMGLDGAELRNIVSLPISDRIKDLQVGSCEIRGMLHQITSAKFRTMTLNHFGLERILYIDKCSLTTNKSNCVKEFPGHCTRATLPTSSWPDIHLRYRIFTNGVNSTRWLIHIATLLKRLPWKVIEIDLAWKDVNNATLSSVTNGLRTLPPGINVACTASSAFKSDAKIVRANGHQNRLTIESVYEECSYMWTETKMLVWDIYIPDLDIQPSELMLKLVSLENYRQNVLKIFPEMKVMLRINLGIKDDGERIMKNTYTMNRGRYGIYCNPSLLKMNTLGELVISFAKVHNVPIEVRDVLGHFDQDGGGWRALETVEEISNVTKSFPMYVARDYPANFLLGDFRMDRCLTWTENVSQDGMYFHQDFVGTTLHMSGMRSGDEPLTPYELEILLLFVFHKFTLVEVIADTIADLGTLLHVLSVEEFLQKLKLPDRDDYVVNTRLPQLYLNINWDFSSTSQDESTQMWNLLYKLVTVTLKPIGIHFAGPKNNFHFDKNLDLEFSKLRKEGIRLELGLALEDCLKEVNLGFINLRNSELLQRANYLICNVEHVAVASNVDRHKTGKYLDSTLFIKQYFKEVFTANNKSLRIELFFRMNSSPTQAYSSGENNERSQISQFLRFFSDVSQYAPLQEMRFFMLPSFDDQAGNRHGWWKVSNYKNLSKPSAFTEKEADYLRRVTWRPPSEEADAELSDMGDNGTGVIVPVMVIVVIVLANALLLVIFWYRRRFAILSRGEVAEFRNGKAGDGSASSDSEGGIDTRKFPAEYDLAENRFVLLNIIGKGNFGLVYKANLSNPDGSGSTPVAVKMPHPDCTKDSLKSMLSELKVLCYVGSHPHVIEFIGAYIAELGRGKIYIATQLCENGALIEHLRKLDLEQTSEMGLEERMNGDHYELIRFSHEISLGMEYIASRKIVHGDLSARNILLDSNLHCKIADFGLSRKLYQYQEYVKKNAEPLPWRWMAVESLKRMEFTTKSDVWSFGVTIWEIFSLGSTPYPGLSWTTGFVDDLEHGLRMSAPKYASHEIYEMIPTCWNVNPGDRPSFTELSQFFAETRNKEYILI